MADKYHNKYRVQSARLQKWDYRWNAAYFITICTQNRENYFGDIPIVETPNLGVSTVTPKLCVPTVNPSTTVNLSDIGQLAQKFWNEIPEHFPFVRLDAFVIMPNHVHGIIIIDDNNDQMAVETPKLGVSTTRVGVNAVHWKPGTIGVIINQFKRILTINARKLNENFAWQSRFYDHIIRDDASFSRIQSYIIENPIKWKDDKFYRR